MSEEIKPGQVRRQLLAGGRERHWTVVSFDGEFWCCEAAGGYKGGWYPSTLRGFSLISDPSSPTKEAEPVRLGTNGVCSSCGSADPKAHWSDCSTRAKETEPVKSYGSQLPYMSEADICAATEKRNAEYQLEQAAAIKKRWLEQQANPHQYLAYGRVQAEGWQQRGWGRR